MAAYTIMLLTIGSSSLLIELNLTELWLNHFSPISMRCSIHDVNDRVELFINSPFTDHDDDDGDDASTICSLRFAIVKFDIQVKCFC